MNESAMLGRSEFGKAAARRDRADGHGVLPSTFVQGSSAVNTRKLENPLAVYRARPGDRAELRAPDACRDVPETP